MTTIGEKLTGKSMQHYIPIEKRSEPKTTDGPGNRYRIMEYVKAHNGEIIRQDVLAKELGLAPNTINAYMQILVKQKKLTKEKVGQLRRYYVGKVPVRDHGIVETVKPAAPVSKPELRKTDIEAWEYVKTLSSVPDAEFAQQVKGILGLISYMRGTSPEITLNEPMNEPIKNEPINERVGK